MKTRLSGSVGFFGTRGGGHCFGMQSASIPPLSLPPVSVYLPSVPLLPQEKLFRTGQIQESIQLKMFSCIADRFGIFHFSADWFLRNSYALSKLEDKSFFSFSTRCPAAAAHVDMKYKQLFLSPLFSSRRCPRYRIYKSRFLFAILVTKDGNKHWFSSILRFTVHCKNITKIAKSFAMPFLIYRGIGGSSNSVPFGPRFREAKKGKKKWKNGEDNGR